MVRCGVDIDTLAPSTVRAQNITLALASQAAPTAFRAIDVAVAPTGDALTSGLSLPLELSVTSPSSSRTGNVIYTHVFRRAVPSIVTFMPKEGGTFIIRLRELQHMKWWGSLTLVVQGDPLYVPD